MRRLIPLLVLPLVLSACVGIRRSVSVTAVVITAVIPGGGPTATPPSAPTPVPTQGAAASTPTPVSEATPVNEATPVSEATPASEATLSPAAPNPGAYAWQLVAQGFVNPIFLTHANDGSGRLFVAEQGGKILLLQDGAVQAEPFLDLTGIAVESASERGLLGLAFHPDYATTGQFFVNYTDVNGDTVIARYSVSADPNRADPASAEVLLQIDQPFRNHNGGDIAFGPDGYLYIGLGDGGSAGDPEGNGQDLNTLLGKLLRIDVNADPYAVPGDNPFANSADAKPQIWAYGLRNPWRFSFDRATGDLYLGDVGQGEWEEINFQPAASAGGENYGWVLYEGNHPYAGGSSEGLVFPVTEYSHGEGGCSVTGGYVYRGPSLPDLNGVYLFGDYCTGLVWSLYQTEAQTWVRDLFANTSFNISSFGEDQAGELYLLDHSGAIYQLVAAQ